MRTTNFRHSSACSLTCVCKQLGPPDELDQRKRTANCPSRTKTQDVEQEAAEVTEIGQNEIPLCFLCCLLFKFAFSSGLGSRATRDRCLIVFADEISRS